MRHLERLFDIVFLAAIAVVVGVPLIAFAQQAASLPTDVPGIIAWFKDTHAAGHWSLLIGGALTLFLRFAPLVKPWLDKLPAESTKWVAMGLAMLGSISTGFMAGNVPWYTVLFNGLHVGVAAIGGWELVLKPLLTKLGLQTPAPPAATPPAPGSFGGT